MFRVRDLMFGGFGNGGAALGCTHCTQCSECTIVGGTCPGVSCGCTVNPVTSTLGFTSPEGLRRLRIRLKLALAGIEAQERVLEETLRPQTLEEIEDLESRLLRALEELRLRKEQLQYRD